MADEINFYNFSNMHIDLSKVSPGQTVLEYFPELSNWPPYLKATDVEVRIALLMCDPKGPFSKIKRYEVRLQNVAKWLKLKVTGEDKEFYEEVLQVKNQKIVDIWAVYLADVFDHEWVSWFSSSLIYYQMHAELLKPIEFTDDKSWERRNKIEGRVDAVYKRMKAMEEIIFVDDTIKRKSFEANKNLIENFPEKHADDNSVV